MGQVSKQQEGGRLKVEATAALLLEEGIGCAHLSRYTESRPLFSAFPGLGSHAMRAICVDARGGRCEQRRILARHLNGKDQDVSRKKTETFQQTRPRRFNGQDRVVSTDTASCRQRLQTRKGYEIYLARGAAIEDEEVSRHDTLKIGLSPLLA